MDIESPLFKNHHRLIKRIFDLVLSLFFCIFILPPITIFIGTIIKLDSKGPIIYKQIRVGKDRKQFVLYKFRTMYHPNREIDVNGNFLQTSKNDLRITKFGKFLRRTSIDELPQFINVLKGDMSIVGPRPHATIHDDDFVSRIENYNYRYKIRPGITGLAQVNGSRGETYDINLMKKRIDYDLWYIKNWSFWLDIQIVFLTIWKTVKGDPNAY